MPSGATGTGSTSFEVQPSLYKESHPVIHVSSSHERDVTRNMHRDFASQSVIGLAGEYKTGRLVQLTLATPQHSLLIRITSARRSNHLSSILLNPEITLVGFNLDRLALALHCDADLRINRGVDILSLCPKRVCRTSVHDIASMLGPKGIPNIPKIANIFQDEKNDPKRKECSVMRAWTACHVAHLERWAASMDRVDRIDTSGFEKPHLDFLGKVMQDSSRLEALKPAFTKNDISEQVLSKKGKLEVTGTRFKTRLRVSGSQTLRLDMKGKGNEAQKGHVTKVQGKNASISTNKPVPPGAISSIITIGKDEPTSAEFKKAEIILGTLQRRISLFKNPLVQAVWFSGGTKADTRPTNSTTTSNWRAAVNVPPNDSQARAIELILRPCMNPNDVQTIMIHGPPGTGKTSVVAAFVQAIQNLSKVEYGEAVYLTAQSNVAVKNMAKKLDKIGFTHWKLIVSHDFHFDWHEHLYEEIRQNVMESKDLPETFHGMQRMFGGIRVILCTLSMLSNKRLSDLTRLFNPRTIIVDEASQIEVGDYLPVFHTFEKSLRRVCFVGDDKQLAPFGQDDIQALQSIFEIQSLRSEAIFLDTQYIHSLHCEDRMPQPIGHFISQAVYNNQLKSSHPVNSKSSCRFVDVSEGHEIKDGNSWKNLQEIQLVVKLVEQARKNGEDFRVITPYDAQRNALEAALKRARLPWEDRCFNVDSFQGNEADHIIVSLVRTEKPGFLNNERRTNVLLTRCKKQMTICSNRLFLQHKARSTLVGQMAVAWGGSHWISWNDVLNRQV